MFKSFRDKLRRFWWYEFHIEMDRRFNHLIQVVAEHHRRNDQEYENQRKLDEMDRRFNHLIQVIAEHHRRNDQEYENQRKLDDPLHLDRFGYKVYSQNDEDGIINEIFKRIGTTNKVFVEFGVQDGLESNCHFLLFNGWKGLWIDGDEKCFANLQKYFEKPLASKQLSAVNGFITKDNINKLIGEDGKITGEIDLLSIDIDGNDYWIWKAINCIQPRVVVIEYNAKFPPPCEWVMEYDVGHAWDGSDKHGASLKSLELLGKNLGYRLVGTNTNGVNAFFVKKELTRDLFAAPATAENLYHAWNYWFTSSGHPTKKYIGT